ncbi:MAG: helicase-related protein [Anaerolineales bacterium]
MEDNLQPGDWIIGPFWEEAVKIVACEPHSGYDLVTVAWEGERSTRSYVLTPTDRSRLSRTARADFQGIAFDGDPERFRLAIEAHRLRLAHAIDPYAALNASRIDPLPHQFEAVYEQLLARPVVRALLAHDAGAGKTIMAGLLIKELQRRQGVQRVLVVAPAGLKAQWRRELLTKFGLDFPIVDREYIEEQGSDHLLVWRETGLAITSIAFARQEGIRQALESVEWDMVVVDEAHKMAAYRRSTGSLRKTHAYELGEVLSRHSTHFLLMTATPHKGDPENYRLLVSLIDPREAEHVSQIEGANPRVLRRTKEEMRKPNGDSLYPKREVETIPYYISHEEGELLRRVRRFARQHYQQMTSTQQQSAAFAMLTLDRRLASSPYALRESLVRMRQQITDLLEIHRRRRGTDGDGDGDWAAWEELTEEDRWEEEARAERAAAAWMGRRRARAELRELDALIEKADDLLERGRQEKLRALQEACDLWVGKDGEQLIVFTEFKDTLDYLNTQLQAWGYATTQIHGDMEMKERRQAERIFWKGEAQILLATEAAGEGINLQCCSVLINYDIPWNPCRLEQRMGRIHRYGQEAPVVHIFNLVALNTMEGEVQEVILQKMKAMRDDLRDRVFNVLGEALWGHELREAFVKIALDQEEGVTEAKRLVERRAEDVRQAEDAKERTAALNEPLDVARFRRKQATFAAHRLSPEDAEAFFRRAIVFVGGAFTEFQVVADEGDGESYSAFEVTLPSGWERGMPRKQRLSFWPTACSDDETLEDAVLFIAPGHRLFEALLDRVLEECAPDLSQGALFLDRQPATESPYLVWFVRDEIRDGLGRSAGDLLEAVEHRADCEEVAALSTEILEAFDGDAGEREESAVRQGQVMLEAQETIIEACVLGPFLAQLGERRAERAETLAQERRFLEDGLDALAAELSQTAVEAFVEGDTERGDELTNQSDVVQRRKAALLRELERSGQLLLEAPEVLGVALVLPEPLEVEIETEQGTQRVAMRRDPAVELAAMEAVMEHERERGRFPKDVHVGNSWDVESYDAQGNLLRCIEVKGRGPEDADVVSLTEPEWEAARRLGDQHWLYIVRLGDGQFTMVQNPCAKLQPQALRRWVVKIKDAAELGETVMLRNES